MIYIGQNRVGLNAITKVVAPPDQSSSNKPVKFRDCDGTVLYSYSIEEVANMTALPALPTRSGLTCQEWNWTLQQVKDYVALYGKCEVGATYTTDDGKTRIKITIQDPKYSNIPIVFQQTVANGVEVNWGDGSATQTYSSTSQQTITHQYSPSAFPASYTISFKVNSGTMSFPTYIMGKYGNDAYVWISIINEVNIGNNITSVGQNVFSNCQLLNLVTIPNSVTSIGNNAFCVCRNLSSITIPNSIISIGDSVFYACNLLISIAIPNSVTSIGTQAISYCVSLASITIPSSVTSIGNNAFQYCPSLASITIPSSVTSIGNSIFYNCYSLISITISSSVLSIGQNLFYGCYSLASITIPSSVTSIGNNAFYNCYGLKTFDFRRNTEVPILTVVNAFKNTPTVKEIVVPDELYDDWIAASNWSSSTNQIKESIVKASESSLGPLI